METCYRCNNTFMCACVYQPSNQRKICLVKSGTLIKNYPASVNKDGKIIHLCSENCIEYKKPEPKKIKEKQPIEIPAEAYRLYEKAKNSLLGAAPLPSPDQWMTTVTKKMKAAWKELNITEKNELTDYMNFMYNLTTKK